MSYNNLPQTILSVSNLNSKKLYIKDIYLIGNSIKLDLSSEIFKVYDEVIGVIKNTKTRAEYFFNILFEYNSLTFNISNLQNFFSDYEGEFFILLQKDNHYFSYTPIFSPMPKESYNIYINDLGLYNWYVRILKNGELRISSITKAK